MYDYFYIIVTGDPTWEFLKELDTIAVHYHISIEISPTSDGYHLNLDDFTSWCHMVHCLCAHYDARSVAGGKSYHSIDNEGRVVFATYELEWLGKTIRLQPVCEW